MKKMILTIALASSLVLGACASDGSPNSWGMGTKQTVGTAGGAVLGGILGSKVGGGSGRLWATGAGALLGAFVGSEVGKSLDNADRAYHAQAVEKAYNAPLNQTINWDNPESGHSGSVTPVREGHLKTTGSLCREYKQTITIDGRSETAVGTACQNQDGSWQVQH